MRIGLPKLFYGDFDDTSHRFVLVLEDLRGMESTDQVAGADAGRTIRALRGAAQLHGQYWNRLDQPPLSHFFAFAGQQKAWLSQIIYLVCLAPCLDRFGGLFPADEGEQPTEDGAVCRRRRSIDGTMRRPRQV